MRAIVPVFMFCALCISAAGLGAVLALVVVTNPAAAQGAGCAPRATVAENLERVHRERPRGFGTLPDGGVVELWESPTGSWTIIWTSPRLISCPLAMGRDGFHVAEPPEPKPDLDAS